ncbi:hypothetical protein BGZ70_001263 [Mortierella alpina]|uniref:Uncharacterized protein n=1 Tax=Mortierella alpina TaxID=64518 RepID=A0A9P6IW91_MORAP|nr:hypothetical protein BGZ70_001263 [Mortierella alpina]
MSDAIAQDATPHPRHGIRRRPASSASPQHPDDSRPHSEDEEDDDDDSDLDLSHATQKQRKSTPGSTPGFPLSVFGHHPSSQDTAATVITTTTTTTTTSASRRARKERHARGDSLDSSDSNVDDDEDDDDDFLDPERANRKQRRRRRRISTSASHLLAQAPPVPDLRFDHNYRKALDQIYETHAQESARAAASAAAASAEETLSESSLQQQQQHPVRVPSIAARITVMTLRDIIIMPFVHGFFWGFGTVLLTLAGQRTLSYHVQRTWKRLIGANPDDTPLVTRGEPARVRTTGSGGGGFGGLGLMNAGSGFGKQSSFGRSSTHTAY